MLAAVLHTIGAPPRCEEFAEPIPADGEVIVNVLAAALKPVDRQIASGSHYARPRELPAICGTDGVGRLSDGQRVFFGGARAPYGGMAQRTVVPKAFYFPVPDGVDDETAAALPNPGISAWLTLAFRAKLTAGENVLILGATGVTGRLAVKIAKLLGAGKVVAAGRNPEILNELRQNGADATIRLDASELELKNAYLQEAGDSGFQVVVDYVWGKPTEVFLAAIAKEGFAAVGAETRLVQVGESAGPTISLPAAVLRSTALTIMGTAGIPPIQILVEAMQKVFSHAAAGELRVDTERIALREIEKAWQQQDHGRRCVVIP